MPSAKASLAAIRCSDGIFRTYSTANCSRHVRSLGHRPRMGDHNNRRAIYRNLYQIRLNASDTRSHRPFPSRRFRMRRYLGRRSPRNAAGHRQCRSARAGTPFSARREHWSLARTWHDPRSDRQSSTERECRSTNGGDSDCDPCRDHEV